MNVSTSVKFLRDAVLPKSLMGITTCKGGSLTVCYGQLSRGCNLADGLDVLHSGCSGDKRGVRRSRDEAHSQSFESLRAGDFVDEVARVASDS